MALPEAGSTSTQSPGLAPPCGSEARARISSLGRWGQPSQLEQLRPHSIWRIRDTSTTPGWTTFFTMAF